MVDGSYNWISWKNGWNTKYVADKEIQGMDSLNFTQLLGSIGMDSWHEF